jgi:hypothetical protein
MVIKKILIFTIAVTLALCVCSVVLARANVSLAIKLLLTRQSRTTQILTEVLTDANKGRRNVPAAWCLRGYLHSTNSAIRTLSAIIILRNHSANHDASDIFCAGLFSQDKTARFWTLAECSDVGPSPKILRPYLLGTLLFDEDNCAEAAAILTDMAKKDIDLKTQLLRVVSVMPSVMRKKSCIDEWIVNRGIAQEGMESFPH